MPKKRKYVLKRKLQEVNKNDDQKTCGLLWWHSGWESACQCRGHGFEPWSGRITCVAEQLGPCTTTTEPCATTTEARAPGARALQQEKPQQ